LAQTVVLLQGWLLLLVVLLKEVGMMVAEEMLVLVANDSGRGESHCNSGGSLEGMSETINWRPENE
jgi:hypothetical protein